MSRVLAVLMVAISLILTGLLSSPSVAGDDRGFGTPPPAAEQDGEVQALAGDSYVFREHSTADNERVDLRDDRIDKVWNQHKVNFTALVRVVEWARSPRWKTSPDGIDRGVYKYRIYEYENDNGTLRKTGRWVIIQFVIEWGDGIPDRGWLVTAYPIETQAGRPPKNTATGWTYCPTWLANSVVMGPVNNDRLY